MYEERGRARSAGQLRCPGGGARCRNNPLRILSAAGSKISKQRSTGQDLQHWRTSSTPAGQEKGQTKAQMGGSLHNRPSTDWWSVPSAKRIGQPTRAEPMERSPSLKILCLAPDSVFVSFLCPFFAYFFYISLLPLFSFISLKGSSSDAPLALIKPGGFFNRSLFIRASRPTHASNFRMYLFSSPLYASI